MAATMAPVHPGEILAEDLAEANISQSSLARALGVPRTRISEIVRGERHISADTALRLARFFGTSERYWLNLQAHYDLESTRDALGDELTKVQPFRAAS